MKTTIACSLALSLSLGSLPAQECCESQPKAAVVAQSACCSEGENKVVVAFKALTAEQQKEVRTALTSLVKTCPVGSKVPESAKALDRLYGEALGSLKKVAAEDQLPAALREDAQKQIDAIAQLQALNQQNLDAMKLLAGEEGCSGACEGEEKSAKSDCGSGDCSDAEAKSGCCEQGSAVAFAENVTKKWAGFAADAKKLQQCEASMKTLEDSMAVLKKYDVDAPSMMAVNMKTQAEMLEKACGPIACPKSGLKARHKQVTDSCEWTSGQCDGAAKAVVAASKLVHAMPFVSKSSKAMKKAKTEGECAEAGEKAECSGSCSGK